MLACLGAGTSAAQEPAVFDAQGPDKEVPEGSRFEVSFTLKNATAQRFVPPDFKGLRVRSGPVEMRSAGFVNGKSYSHQSWVYELEAGPPGTYTIGQALVQTASRTLRSQPLVVRVGKAKPGKPKAPAAGSDDRVFVSGELSHESARVGQQVFYQLKLYTQVGISDYDILDLPQLEGFFSQERRRFDTRVQYQTLRGKKYAVRILYEMALFPQETGNLLIGPARVRLGVESRSGGLRGLLGATTALQQTQPVVLRVEPLPDPVPEQFSGGVGTYSWSVVADKSTLTTDDALTLTVTLEGNGDARRFANPRLALPEGLEGFEAKIREQEEYETGDQFVHARTLEYVVLPQEPGDYTLLPELTVFDPDSNRYRTLRPDSPVAFTVTPGPNYGKQPEPESPESASQAPSVSLWDDLWREVHQWFSPTVFWSILAGLTITGATLFFWQRRQRRPASPDTTQVSPVREKPSRRQLRLRLQEVRTYMAQENPKVFYHELLKTLQAHLALLLGMEPVLLTPTVLAEQLTARGVPPQTRDALLRVWETCEKAVFAGQADAANMQSTWQAAEGALQQLEGMGR